ncbi:MAG: DUF86 domain-containing protein [bacterium]|nr:DUF86 domain-containing protein [bacterium]
MTKRNISLYTKDILDSINKIEEFVNGMDFDEFLNDDKTSSAVIRKLEIIGEAVKQLPDQIKKNNTEIPWKEMAGMRDKLIHWYFGVDYEVVWNVVTEELPQLKGLLNEIFDNIITNDSDGRT